MPRQPARETPVCDVAGRFETDAPVLETVSFQEPPVVFETLRLLGPTRQ